jgi:hypothetical protein
VRLTDTYENALVGDHYSPRQQLQLTNHTSTRWLAKSVEFTPKQSEEISAWSFCVYISSTQLKKQNFLSLDEVKVATLAKMNVLCAYFSRLSRQTEQRYTHLHT